MRYVIDSYAWIEYFLGSKKGDEVRKVLESSSNEIFIENFENPYNCQNSLREL